MVSNEAQPRKIHKKWRMSASGWTDKLTVAAMIIVNVALVIALVMCLVVYSNQNQKESYQQNVESITDLTEAKARLAETMLFASGSSIESLSNMCEGKTLDETLDILNVYGSESGEEFQLLKCIQTDDPITYSGKSSKKSGEFYKSIEYKSNSHENLIATMHFYRDSTDIIYSTEFSNVNGGLKSYSAIHSLNLMDGGELERYIMLNPQPCSSLRDSLTMETQYPDMAFAICNADGNYLAKDTDFRSNNFFKYLYEYNAEMSLVQMNDIIVAFNNDEDGVGMLNYKDSKGRESTFAYCQFEDEQKWYVIVSVPDEDFVSNEMLNEYVIIIIVILLALLVFDMALLLQIIKKLRESVVSARYANQAKTNFLSRMSHDMRTPLNSIINFSDFIIGTDSLDEAKEFGEKVVKSGKYLLTLINDTLSMSRIETGNLILKPKPLDFGEFEEGLLSVLGDKAEKKGVKLSIQAVNAHGAVLLLDPLRLQQVFVNLLNNAIKFTPSGGTVDLIVSSTDNQNGVITLKFEVIDTGRGMSEDFVNNHLFMPFSQERTGTDVEETGTGLGLSIAKSVVEQMHGTITCTSKLGEGTTFVVTIPAQIVEEDGTVTASAPVKAKQEEVDLKDKCVLLCEDNALNREVVLHMLGRIGCNVEMAENGQIGVDKFASSEEGYYDAVLMDRRMPVMDGVEATKVIRALERADAKDVPIIALSADVFNEYIEKSMSSGMTAYLAKPIDAKTLYMALSTVIADREERHQKASKKSIKG